MRLVGAALALMVAASAAAAAPAAPSRPDTPAFARRDDAFLRAYPLTVDAPVVHVPRCSDVDAFEGQLAFANVDVTAHVPFPGVDRRAHYFGRTRFSIRRVTLHLPADVVWPGMTKRDRLAVTASLAALRHHEVGHVRVAAAEVARLNAAPLTVTPDAEVYRQTEIRRQTAGLAAIARAQAAYDALTAHGRAQPRAPEPLRGPVTQLRCEAL